MKRRLSIGLIALKLIGAFGIILGVVFGNIHGLNLNSVLAFGFLAGLLFCDAVQDGKALANSEHRTSQERL